MSNVKVDIFLFCLISIGITTTFPVTQIYATMATDAVKPVLLNQVKAGNEVIALQQQQPTAANQSFAVDNKTLITPQALAGPTTTVYNNPCIGGIPCGTWRLEAFGITGYLYIAPVDNQGKINGTVFGQIITGTWEFILKRVTFTQTITSGTNRSVSYEWSGFYHSIYSITTTLPSCFIISGSAIPKSLPPEQAARQEFGWIAFGIGPERQPGFMP